MLSSRPTRRKTKEQRPPAQLDGEPRILGPGEHPVRPAQIDPVILGIVNRLRGAGYLALVVGGAVRDLLLGRTPKDFDVVTSAQPEEIKRLFPRARIIGRRFRLVLLRVGEREVEISTFRAPPRRPQVRRGRPIARDNTYGTPSEDAFRRDFAVNALAFDPGSFSVIDYVGGLEDLRRGLIRTIGPPEASFLEDPVRMLRAIRFKLRLGFSLHPGLEAALRRMAGQLALVPRHRLAEELQRFLTAGRAEATFAEFRRFGLLEPLLGLEAHPRYFHREALADPYSLLLPYLRTLDAWAAGGGEPIPPTVALLGLLVGLVRPELKDDLLGKAASSALKRSVVRELRRHTPRMLGDWGLLKGQVLPALRILTLARALLRQRRAGRLGGRPSRLGLREAWLLLIVLRDVLDLDEALLEQGRAAIPGLVPMPILDHHQPWRRGAPPHPDPAQGTAPSSGPRHRRRRGRRRRRSSAAQAD
jgi:poly(A) polymerase